MNIERLKNSIKYSEGCRLRPYLDSVGVLTIGYGRNLEAKGINSYEAEIMLDRDIYEARQAAANLAGYEQAEGVRQEVVVEMVFQLGLGGVLNFSKFLAAFAAGDYGVAADEMLDSRWAKQTPTRAERLAERMRTGKH